MLHALARGGRGAGDGGQPGAGGPPLPAAAIVGRIRALVPPGIGITIILDGPPAPGGGARRAASGVEIRHSGARPADELIRDLARAAPGPGATLAVTDDTELAAALRAAGARTARSAWLLGRLDRQRIAAPAAGRPGAPPVGAGRPPGSAADGDEGTGRRWKPGRGATRKTGNPRRGRPRP